MKRSHKKTTADKSDKTIEINKSEDIGERRENQIIP